MAFHPKVSSFFDFNAVTEENLCLKDIYKLLRAMSLSLTHDHEECKAIEIRAQENECKYI